ncbi:MAG: DUF350 domain-containing protein [Gemmataceae bacterium]|nr:DUF350 domain-containing protein [Gemmataceae bacterium]
MYFHLLADATVADWHARSIQEALMHSAAFGLLGIVLAIVGFKLFDWLTPGDLQKEIIENKNVSAAIITSAFILGVCLIIAAAVH